MSKVGFGVLDVGFGIWDIIDSAKDIREGSAQAKEFRKGAEAIVERKKEINELFNNITRRCDSTARKVSCKNVSQKLYAAQSQFIFRRIAILLSGAPGVPASLLMVHHLLTLMALSVQILYK